MEINQRINKIFNKNQGLNAECIEYPKTILIEITNLCNSNCIFCANSKMTRKKGFINKNFCFSILKQAYDLGTREVGFYTTGEPLLNKDLPNYINYAKKIGYNYIYITTNGILANYNTIKNLYDNGLDSIKFSINAIDKNTYYNVHNVDVFDKVIENLKEIYLHKKIDNLNLKIYVSYIATKYTNVDHLTIKNFFKNMCDNIIVVNVRNQSGMMPEIPELLSNDSATDNIQSKRILPCYYTFKNFIVTKEGYLTACCTDFNNYLAYSDLKKEDLKTAWNNNYIKRLRLMQLENNLGKSLCNNCINNTREMPFPLRAELATPINKDIFKISDEKILNFINKLEGKMELVNIFNKRRENTNIVKDRHDVQPGEYRISVHIWILNEDKMLIQQRVFTTKKFPGLWSQTAGGVEKDESSLQACKRECLEELGLNVSDDEITYVGSYTRLRDIVDIFLVETKIDINKLTLQNDEVNAVKLVSFNEFEQMIKNNEVVPSINPSYEYFKNYINEFKGKE